MEIFGIVASLVTIIILGALGLLLFAFKDMWDANKKIKRLSRMAGSMPKHRWLIRMGMEEQAIYFNAFGVRLFNYKPDKWY